MMRIFPAESKIIQQGGPLIECRQTAIVFGQKEKNHAHQAGKTGRISLSVRFCANGSALIEEGMRRAKAMGFTSIFLVGAPDYYSRFGFHPVASYGIRHNSEIPDQYIMAKALVPGVLDGIDGTITII